MVDLKAWGKVCSWCMGWGVVPQCIADREETLLVDFSFGMGDKELGEDESCSFASLNVQELLRCYLL